MDDVSKTNEYFMLAVGQPFTELPEDSGEYNDVISVHMAEDARLAYCDQYQIAKVLKGRGFDRLSFF